MMAAPTPGPAVSGNLPETKVSDSVVRPRHLDTRTAAMIAAEAGYVRSLYDEK